MNTENNHAFSDMTSMPAGYRDERLSFQSMSPYWATDENVDISIAWKWFA